MSALAERLREVLREHTEARPLPAECYTDAAHFELELRALFAEPGFACASKDELEGPSRWRRVHHGARRWVASRDAEGALHLLRDVCLHRSVALLDGEQGAWPEEGVRCPYHGWCYAAQGKLRRAPDAPNPGALAGATLREGSVWASGPLLFASTGEVEEADRWSAPSWLASLELGRLRLARRRSWDTDANWKLLVENFQESHHFASVHPWLEARTPWRRSRSVTVGEGWLGGTMELANGAETVSTTGLLRGRALLAGGRADGGVYDAWLAPNVLTSVQPDYLLVYRLHPLSPSRTRVVAEVHFHAETPRGEHEEEVFAFWDRTNAEDRAICERQQRGLAAGAAPGCYTASEDGVHAFDAWVARATLRALGERE